MPEETKKPVDTTKSKDLKEKFNKIGQQIREVVVDFTTLNVTTLSGEIQHVIDTEGRKRARFDFTEVMKEIGDLGHKKTKVYVVAHTQIAFDHDTVNFFKEDLKVPEAKLIQFHLQACESAQSSRRSFLHFIKELK